MSHYSLADLDIALTKTLEAFEAQHAGYPQHEVFVVRLRDLVRDIRTELGFVPVDRQE
jgi:hypothetical protein